MGEERLGRAGQAVWPTTTEWAHLMSICTYMLIKWVCAVHVCTLLSSCEALMRVSSKLGASISSTPSSRRLSMGKNTLEGGGREGRGGEGDGRTLVTAAVLRRDNRRSIRAGFETSALTPPPAPPYFKILARTLHHLHTLLNLPYTTTLPHIPTLPSRTPHLQEASLPLVGRQPLQVMGEQGSLQVADGHVADVATRVTAHASHSLGGEGRERRRGEGSKEGKGRGRGGNGGERRGEEGGEGGEMRGGRG